MEFDMKTFDNMAEISKIGFSEEEKIQMIESLQNIVESMSKVKDIDTLNIKPMYVITPMTNVLREDKVLESLDRDAMLSNAPEREDGYYSVPKIID